MASYRFCRSDDVPLLVEAYNACFRPPAGFRPIDAGRFKRWIRVLELWTSSCMVALEGERKIGVLLAAKRETENCVLAVGIDPELRGAGHGRHLMTSLSAKLAILGPPRLVCEAPGEDAGFLRFLERCGYRESTRYRDWRLEPPFAPSPVPAGMVAEISLEDLAAAGLDCDPEGICWGRASRAIARRREYFDSVRVYAVAGAERIEAALVVESPAAATGARRLLALRAPADERGEKAAAALLRHYAAAAATPVVWQRVHEAECGAERAAALGFVAGGTTVRMTAQATPA